MIPKHLYLGLVNSKDIVLGCFWFVQLQFCHSVIRFLEKGDFFLATLQ